MLNTLAVIAMVLIAAYLWRSSEVLHYLSAGPHGEDDITSTGALLLLRSICTAVLLLAVLLVASSRQPVHETSPENPEHFDSRSDTTEPDSELSASIPPAVAPTP